MSIRRPRTHKALQAALKEALEEELEAQAEQEAWASFYDAIADRPNRWRSPPRPGWW